MSSSANSKPVVIIHSKTLLHEEYAEFYKHFNQVVVINDLTRDKKLSSLTQNDIIVCDIRKQVGRDYWAENSRLCDEKDCIVWVRSSGDRLPDDKTLGHTYECKRIRTGLSKPEFLHHLMQKVSVPKIQGKFKRALRFILNCLRG